MVGLKKEHVLVCEPFLVFCAGWMLSLCRHGDFEVVDAVFYIKFVDFELQRRV